MVSDLLVGVLHSAPEDGSEDHLDVLDEGVVVEVVEIDADLVRQVWIIRNNSGQRDR